MQMSWCKKTSLVLVPLMSHFLDDLRFLLHAISVGVSK